MLRLQGNQLNKWIKPIHQWCWDPSMHCYPKRTVFLVGWADEFQSDTLFSCRSTALGKQVSLFQWGATLWAWKRKHVCGSVYVWACACVCAHSRPQEGVRNTTREFVRHLEPGLLDLICGAPSLIGQSPLHCQCVFYNESCREAFGSRNLLPSFYLWVFNYCYT